MWVPHGSLNESHNAHSLSNKENHSPLSNQTPKEQSSGLQNPDLINKEPTEPIQEQIVVVPGSSNSLSFGATWDPQHSEAFTLNDSWEMPLESVGGIDWTHDDAGSNEHLNKLGVPPTPQLK